MPVKTKGSKLKLEIVQADYHNNEHAQAVVQLLDAYARDAMGGGHALSEAVKQQLVAELARRPSAFSVLAFVDGHAAGLINCFEGFSTFACKPLINIHDVAVASAYRRQGIAQAMMAKVEQIAEERGCCKLTLEVLSGNHGAQEMYRKLGYAGYQLDAETGGALFWQKRLIA
ncbi:MAG TPA: GNAT family N-acetyltransferase [Burkholderiaceae bacterium]|nr:GNAT family N-acetyltransferase [Burkholderiaceae bacterium]